MKNQTLPEVDRSKTTPIAFLFATATLIFLAGAAFTVYSVIADIQFPMLGSEVHGAVLGAILMFLGIRYLLSVRKLSSEVYKSTSRFSWENFRSDKSRQRQTRRS